MPRLLAHIVALLILAIRLPRADRETLLLIARRLLADRDAA